MKDHIHLTLVSSNKKTGPIPVSTSSAETCPGVCPFKAKGCYAKSGPLAIHWKKITEKSRGSSNEKFLNQIKSLPKNQLWRHNQAGDLYGKGDKIDVNLLAELVEANKGKRGFAYTHKPAKGENLRAIQNANKNGFTINLSANNIKHADELVGKGAPVVCVVDSEEKRKSFLTPKGNKVVICPATYRNNVNCSTCQLCQKSNRSAIVAFPAHGTGKKSVNEIISK